MRYTVNPGDVFGYITVLERIKAPKGKRAKRGPYYLCACAFCENTGYIATSSDLRSGRIISCGCYRKALAKTMHITHGQSVNKKRTQVYESWQEMKRRCDNPLRQNYPWYGGRGIKYDPRWKEFKNFLADMGETAEGMTLDRIDSTKDYYKDNCRWATKEENSAYHPR